MKFVKYIVAVIVAIIALPFIVALFVDGSYHVEKEITIARPKSEVFDYVKYLKNQDSYSVWARMDPNMKKEFRGTDATVGFVSAWDSENKQVGRGEQEITRIVDGDRIEMDLRFFEPFEATDHAYMTTESVSDSETHVKWGFHGKMDYPMNLMMLTMNMDEMVGSDLQHGLNNLKKLLEQKN